MISSFSSNGSAGSEEMDRGANEPENNFNGRTDPYSPNEHGERSIFRIPLKIPPSPKCSISTFFLSPFSSPFLPYPAGCIIQQQRIAREEVHATVPTVPFLPLSFLRLDTGSVSSSSSFGAQGQTIQQAGSVGLAAGGRPKTEEKEGEGKEAASGKPDFSPPFRF